MFNNLYVDRLEYPLILSIKPLIPVSITRNDKKIESFMLVRQKVKNIQKIGSKIFDS